MQYALLHKWVERLTHTNIHISPEEEIPQGWDGAICVWQREHKENRAQHIQKKKKKGSKAEKCYNYHGDDSI